jgi:hypothetical protein
VTARHRDFNRAFDMSLALNISEIDVIYLMCRKKSSQISTRWKQGSLAAQERECLSQILHAVDVDLIDHRGFESVCLRHE